MRLDPEDRLPLACLAFAMAVLVWSGVGPKDRATWVAEVAPVLIGMPTLVATYRRFPLTPLLYVLIALHAAVLCVGGHYTYAEVPIGFWVRDALHLSRNHYDRLGHVVQGFVPALVAREVLLRTSPLRPGKWLFFLVTCVCLALSAFYELIEWWSAAAYGQSAEAFLGTQGDPWDAQKDMLMALLGAVAAQLLLSRFQDRHLSRLGLSRPATA